MHTTTKERLDDLLLDGLPDLVSPQDLARLLPLGDYTETGLQGLIGKWLASIGAVKHRRYTGAGKDPRTLWSIRDHHLYAKMGPAKRLATYKEMFD